MWLNNLFKGRDLAECDSADERKAAAKASYLERRKQLKAKQQAQMNNEQASMIAQHLPQLKELLKESNQDLKEKRDERTKLRKSYDEHVTLRKYKHNVKKRLEQAQQNIVAIELNKFAREVLFRKTDDEEVYAYQRKLQRQMQHAMLWKQWLPLGLGAALFKLTRRLKKASGQDIFYFVVPYLYGNYGIFCVEQKSLFEAGYPAHPYVIEQRMQVINKTCCSYPAILKNEIEYIHTKLSEERAARAELEKETGDKSENEAKAQDESQSDDSVLKYERVFTIGQVTSDYKKLLKSQANQETDTKEVEGKKLLKFKVIVEDGELYLQCIDPFEQIFEVSREQIEHLELTELLDPFMFDTHRDIINALFEVYYTLSQDYLKVFYHQAREKANGTQASSLQDRATAKLRQQYNLDGDESDKSDLTRKTVRDAQQRV